MDKFDEKTSSFAELSGVDSLDEINTTNVQITRKIYILTIGFEVNHPEAFVDGIQDLSVDYGHAFFYVTRSDEVTTFFSFGPKGLGTPGKITDEYNGRRPATTSYQISEVSRNFRLIITEIQAVETVDKVDAFTKDVNDGKEFYDASKNDTCAETAKDILDGVGISTPEGSGPVSGGGVDWFTGKFNFTNPYMWYSNFCKEYGEPVIYIGGNGNYSLSGNSFELKTGERWILNAGDKDPLSGYDAKPIVK